MTDDGACSDLEIPRAAVAASTATATTADLVAAATLDAPDGYRTVELDVEDEADRAAVISVDEWAFAFTWPTDVAEQAVFVPEAGRTVGVRHEQTGDLVAVHSSLESDVAVPGGSLPASALTWVGVHPGHRRRGLATTMLLSHLQRSAARGESLSLLWAAEPEIYGRYGYGAAATSYAATLPRGFALLPVAGAEGLTCSLERLVPDQHRALIVDLLAAGARPGHVTPRRPAHLENYLTDRPSTRDGAETRRIAVVRDADGVARAFASFRRKEKWEPAGPTGIVRVGLWAALDGAAHHTLIRTLCDLDLMGTVELDLLPLDAALTRQLVNVRAANLRLRDNVWVRVVDVAAALSGRGYAAPVDVVLEVTDDVLSANHGRWHLSVSPDGLAAGSAVVERLGQADPRPGDLALDVRELGTAYLGGVSLASLGAAGLVRELTPGSLLAASNAFRSPLEPVCSWQF